MRFRDRFDRSKRQPSTRKQRIGFAFFWLVLLTYAYVIPTSPSFNSESHLYLTFSIVDHHQVTIDRYHTRLGDESYWHGHYYSDKAPGLSFLAVPVYGALRTLFPHKRGTGYEAYPGQRYAIPRDTAYLRYAISYILVMLPSAIFAVLFWLFLARFSRGIGWPLILAGVYAVGTIAFFYSTVFFSHQIAAMLVFGAFMLLYDALRGENADSPPARRLALAGFLAGYAVICEYPTAIIGLVLAAYVAAVARRKLHAVALFAVGALPVACAGIAYNSVAFGQALATGYMHVRSAEYHNEVHGGFLGLANPTAYGVQPPHLSSLWEITFGTYRGIFLVSPVLLLFVPAVAIMWRRRAVRVEALVCVAIVCLYFLMDASRPMDLNGWSGGASIASRHLTPILPFMMFPAAFALDDRRFRFSLLGLGTISVAIMFMTVSATGDFYAADHNPLAHEMWPNFQRGHILVNWGNLLGLTGPASLLPYAVLVALLVLRMLQQARALHRSDVSRVATSNVTPTRLAADHAQ